MEITGKTTIITAIRSGLAAGGDASDWDAPEFKDARRSTRAAGLHWDFTSWTDLLILIEADRRVNGYLLVDAEG